MLSNNKQVRDLIINQQHLKNNIIEAISNKDTKLIKKLFTDNNKHIDNWVNKNIINFYKYNNKKIDSELIKEISKDISKRLKMANRSAKAKILKNLDVFDKLDLKKLNKKQILMLKNDILDESKLFTITTKTGRRLKLDYYCKLVANSAWIQTKNSAIIAKMKIEGKDLCKISSHANACPICKPLENKIYSISGKSKKYPKLPFHNTYLNVHVNCYHYIIVL